ncbi:DEAD/DEAH box helicase [bacterium]|nr:DEAD/DEAH box helicase [bacterium]
MKFEQLNIIPPILRALKEEGYETPTPIQEQSIPAILQRRDILGSAQTGTGKTAAFAIPILQIFNEEQRFDRGSRKIKCLIVTPTRELAIQIGESFEAYGKYLNIKHTVIFGGVNQHSQTKKLQTGVDVLIATPGRLLDLMNQRYVDLQYIKIFTLDEADRMLDMGFIHDVKKIISKLPQKKQSLFFSATMPPVIVDLTKNLLVNPIKVEVAPVSSAAETVKQKLYHVDKSNKRDLLIHVLKEKEIRSALIFTRTKHGADKVARFINQAGINAEAIHGNKSQNARQKALSNFKTKQTRILVATDIAARGIDIDDLSHVINYEIPNVPETYVHRIGRTGRAGASGIALSFCDLEEKSYIKDVEKLLNTSIPVITEHPFHLVSAPAPVKEQVRREYSTNGRNRSQKRWHGRGRKG